MAEPNNAERRFHMRHVLAAAAIAGLMLPPAASAAECGRQGVAVQVLGSGGPVADDARASAGYIVWQDGKARAMIDAGGGTFLRFGEAGARIEDLRLIAISHFHADHSGDFPTLIKSGYFSERSEPLTVSGPSAAKVFPGLNDFLKTMFGPKGGAYAYMSWALDGEGGPFRLTPKEVAIDGGRTEVLDMPSLKVEAIGVAHGPVPALGYLVTAGDKRIAFTGDQNGDNPGFWKLASGADLAVVHLAVPEGAQPAEAALHARPSEIGKNAAGAEIKRVALSHLMARSLNTLDDNLAAIRASYRGPVEVATDLACYPLTD